MLWLFGVCVALLFCWLHHVSITSKNRNMALLIYWLRLLQRLKIVMGIFACASSLLSNIAMQSCLLCMWHCNVVGSVSLSAANQNNNTALLICWWRLLQTLSWKSLLVCQVHSAKHNSAVLFGVHVALLFCWSNVSIRSNKNNTALQICCKDYHGNVCLPGVG